MNICVGINVEISDKHLYVPKDVFEEYKNVGITSIFEWQADCLRIEGVLDGSKNIVYSAPTSAGKTLVAELLVLKRVLSTHKKAFVILPYVSVSREKMVSLQKLFTGVGLRVGGFMGGMSPNGGLASVHIAVCTIEKANSLVNRLIEEDRLSDLGIVVVDELHLIGDPHRGYLLELLLTKLLLHGNMHPEQNIQIVGMSATLTNLPVLADWLRAAHYTTDFRPVPLTELVFMREKAVDRVYAVTSIAEHECLKPLRCLENSCLFSTKESRSLQLDNSDDGVTALCLDTILSGNAVLVFCPTKQWCEQLAESMAKQIFTLAGPFLKSKAETKDIDAGQTLATQLDEQGLSECLNQLKRCPAGLDAALSRCITFGVAFHHAGLTMEEREVIEIGFRNGFLRLLVATSTLSSGVNLPARRVIIRTLLFHGKTLDYLTYKQMVGRAGRKGIDTEGESVLICKPRDLDCVKHLLNDGMPRITSCLLTQSGTPESSLRRALLEVIANGIVETVSDARAYLDSTLLSACLKDDKTHSKEEGNGSQSQRSHRRRSSRRSAASWNLSKFTDHQADILSTCLEVLIDGDLIVRTECKHDENVGICDGEGCRLLRPTSLGRAVLSSSLGPVDGLTVFAELQHARRNVALDTDLHLVYMVTPIYLDVGEGLDWFRYLEIYQSLSTSDRHVADLIGIEERFLMRCLSGCGASKRRVRSNSANILHRRFYTALALHRLICEDGLSAVADRFSVNRGVLQSLTQQASTYAGMVTIFCNRLGWTHMERLLSSFHARLYFGVANELIDLMRLAPLINAMQARALFSGGFTSTASLAKGRVKEIDRLLQRANPYTSTKLENGGFASADSNHNVLLDDGSLVSEYDLAPLLLVRAGELLREDLCSDYGVDLALEAAKSLGKDGEVEAIIGNRAKICEAEKREGNSVFATPSPSPPQSKRVRRSLKISDRIKRQQSPKLVDLVTSRQVMQRLMSPCPLSMSSELSKHSSSIQSLPCNQTNSEQIMLTSVSTALHRSNKIELSSISTSPVVPQCSRANSKIETTVSRYSGKTALTLAPSNSTFASSVNYSTTKSLPLHTKFSETRQLRTNELSQKLMSFEKGDIQSGKLIGCTIPLPTEIHSNLLRSSGNNLSYPSRHPPKDSLSAIELISCCKHTPIINASSTCTIYTATSSDISTFVASKSIPTTAVACAASLLSPSLPTQASFVTVAQIQPDKTIAQSVITANLSSRLVVYPPALFSPISHLQINSVPTVAAFCPIAPTINASLAPPGDALKSFFHDSVNHPELSLLSSSSPLLLANNNCVNSSREKLRLDDGLLNDTFTFSMMEEATTTFEKVCLPVRNLEQSSEANISIEDAFWDYSFTPSVNQISSEDLFENSQVNQIREVPSQSSGLTINSQLPTNDHKAMTSMRKQKEACLTELTSADLGKSDASASPPQPIVSVIDVTASHELWQAFLVEFTEEAGSRVDDPMWISIQPCWEIVATCDADDVRKLVWHCGCAGRPLFGGGRLREGPCLRLTGLCLCSPTPSISRTVFWLPFNQKICETDEVSAVPLDRVLVGLQTLLTASTVDGIRKDPRLIVWDAKWWHRVSSELLHIPSSSPSNIFDPGIQGWLSEPVDGGRPRLKQLVSDPALISALLSLGFDLDPPTQLSDWSRLQQSTVGSPSYQNCVFLSSFTQPSFTPSPWVLNSVAHAYLMSTLDLDPSSCLISQELIIGAMLANSESSGFVLRMDVLLDCRNALETVLGHLENLAYRLVGCEFQLSSPKEVSNILYNRLRLPINTSLSAQLAASRRAKRTGNFGSDFGRCDRQLPTTNATLSQLAHLHPLPRIVIEWRRVHGLLEKTFAGLIASCALAHSHRADKVAIRLSEKVRISPTYDVCTATGRIVSTSPNLQSVPKNIVIDWPDLLTKPPHHSAWGQRQPAASTIGLEEASWPPAIASLLDMMPQQQLVLRPRAAFTSSDGGLLVSADFCHLELRVLAHLSKDPVLLGILMPSSLRNGSTASVKHDAFIRLATHWLKRKEGDIVTADERQKAKQLCYAIIYGMGAHGLATQNQIEVSAAQAIIDDFMQAFPTMASFIRNTIRSAHEMGQVRTMGGRVRILSSLAIDPLLSCGSNLESANKCPALCPTSVIIKPNRITACAIAKAERQAVNSVIQGSAADLTKTAMISLNAALQTEHSRNRFFSRLVLHLHDELIYEVSPVSAVPEFCRLLHRHLTAAGCGFGMTVPLPIKLQVGSSWADLERIDQ